MTLQKYFCPWRILYFFIYNGHYLWLDIFFSNTSMCYRWFDFNAFTMLKFSIQRLSKFASQQLTAGNPNIADLSDKHRPTKIGEFYSELYDNEWSEAFEVIKPLVYPNATEDPDTEYFEEVLRILKNILMVRKCSCCASGFFSLILRFHCKIFLSL